MSGVINVGRSDPGWHRFGPAHWHGAVEFVTFFLEKLLEYSFFFWKRIEYSSWHVVWSCVSSSLLLRAEHGLGWNAADNAFFFLKMKAAIKTCDKPDLISPENPVYP